MNLSTDSQTNTQRFGVLFGFWAGLMSVRLLLQIYLYRNGFLSVSADEFARGIISARWSANPQIDSLPEIIVIWLPLEKYINAVALWLWDDVIVAPRITAFLASCLLLVAFFFVVRDLFDSERVAIVATVLLAFTPWFVWLSGTPMLEIYFLALFWAGLWFLVVWLRERRPHYWLWGGLLLLLTSITHIQSWILINVVNLLSSVVGIKLLRQRKYAEASRLLGFFILNNLFILFFISSEYFLTGKFLGILSAHTAYSIWFYKGYDVPIWDKFAYYPRIVEENMLVMSWVFGLFGLAVIFLEKRNLYWRFYLLMLAVVSLSVYSAFNTLSGPPSAAPGRYSLLYSMLWIPYVAFSLERLFVWGRWANRRTVQIGLMTLSLGLLMVMSWANIRQVIDFPQGMRTEPVAAGRYVEQVLDTWGMDETPQYLLEANAWEFLAVQLTARHYEAMILDRPFDLFNRDAPSMLLQSREEVKEWLENERVILVVLRNEELKAYVETQGLLTPEDDFGGWTVYRFNP